MKGGLVWSHRTKRSRAAKSAQTAVPPIQDGAGSLNNKPTRGWHDTLDKKGIVSNSLRHLLLGTLLAVGCLRTARGRRPGPSRRSFNPQSHSLSNGRFAIGTDVLLN